MKTMQAVAKLIVTRTVPRALSFRGPKNVTCPRSEERQVERDFFYVELGGFDTHNEIHEALPQEHRSFVSFSCMFLEVMDENFDYLNIALEANHRPTACFALPKLCLASCEAFVAELKAQGIFDAVTMVSSSDFGRTLTSNGKALAELASRTSVQCKSSV